MGTPSRRAREGTRSIWATESPPCCGLGNPRPGLYTNRPAVTSLSLSPPWSPASVMPWSPNTSSTVSGGSCRITVSSTLFTSDSLRAISGWCGPYL